MKAEDFDTKFDGNKADIINELDLFALKNSNHGCKVKTCALHKILKLLGRK